MLTCMLFFIAFCELLLKNYVSHLASLKLLGGAAALLPSNVYHCLDVCQDTCSKYGFSLVVFMWFQYLTLARIIWFAILLNKLNLF